MRRNEKKNTKPIRKKMDAKEFVEKMNSIDPKINDNAGFDDGFINEHLNIFKFYPKDQGVKSDNPIVELLTNYDGSKVEIGMVNFVSELNEKGGYLFFGRFDADDLVIDKRTGKVQLKESGQAHILCDCAENSALFLDAIYCSAMHMGQIPLGAEEDEDQALVCDKAMECSAKAGGEAYLTFYKMLMGCFE